MKHCDVIADRILEALEETRPGAVRQAVADHAPHCETCRERVGELSAMAEGLDPDIPAVRPGFVTRVMAEIRGSEVEYNGAYDRLPPIWQIAGAAVLLVALTAIVLASGPGAEGAWHERALTGFLDQALSFLGGLGTGIRGLWDSVIPGRGLPILIGCAALATVLNVAFVVGVMRRKKETVH